jgi:acyl-CoA thioester hydrolase
MYLKQFEVRWNDLDANMHLANSTYFNYISHTRMAFLTDHGLSLQALREHQIGPVVFYEHMYYLREILPGMQIRVSLEVLGMSEDGMFFEFNHNFYDEKGRNLAHCEMMGGWIDLNTRKLIGLTNDLLVSFSAAEKATGFRILTKADTRKYFKSPKDLT